MQKYLYLGKKDTSVFDVTKQQRDCIYWHASNSLGSQHMGKWKLEISKKVKKRFVA